MRTEGRVSIGFLGVVEKILGKVERKWLAVHIYLCIMLFLVAYITQGGKI